MNTSALVGGLVVIGVALVTLITYISPKSNQIITRPANVPTDFSVHYFINGGMSPRGASLVVSSTGAYYEESDNGHKKSWQFVLSAIEIENLYQTLEQNQLSTIETYTQKIYDRGGTTIKYTANNQTISKSDSGIDFVKAGDSQTRFSAIEKVLTDLITKHAK